MKKIFRHLDIVKLSGFFIFSLLAIGLFLTTKPVSAVQTTCADGTVKNAPQSEINQDICKDHGGTENSSTSGPVSGTTSGSTTIDGLVQNAVDLMSAVAGIVIVLSIIIGGIQYMTARDNSSQVAAAKNRIMMSILSLVIFIFTYTILQWLVPGGIF